ncbi:MAG TPA: hypothetical protein VHV50_01850, partial [Actinomycetota bacterium]|nr:hypothetical protein [Actinomycetota bacterium]
ELWIGGPGNKPVTVDITTAIDRKIEALRCHQSQVGTNSDQIAEFVRKYSAEAGQAAGYGFAETFQVISRGPGFHSEEVEEADVDLAVPPVDPRSAPTR